MHYGLGAAKEAAEQSTEQLPNLQNVRDVPLAVYRETHTETVYAA